MQPIRRFHPTLLGMALALFVVSVPDGVAKERVISDHWNLQIIAGDEAGYVREKVIELEENGRIFFRTESTNAIEMKRFGQTIEVAVEGYALEDSAGRLVEQIQKTCMSGADEVVYALEVAGGKAELTLTTMGVDRTVPLEWNDGVLGPRGIQRLRKTQGFEPGTTYSYKTFVADYTKIATVSIEVVERKQTELLDGRSALLFHTVSTNDVIPGLKVHEWCDERAEVIKSSMNMMGLTFETIRTTEARANERKAGELKSDLMIETLVRSNVNLPNPYRLDSILYEFKVKDEDLGLPDNLDDVRQKVVQRNGAVARVAIEAVVPASSQKRPLSDPPGELREFLDANSFLQSDFPPLRSRAMEIVGDETNAWKAACLLESFVYRHITDKNFGTGFATAREVFENRCGDCSEHGVLLAALCRAVGIPARVAMGYMYLGGIFGGHMWAEVWIDGEWYPLDGVMGIGRVDPTHIRFCTSSLQNGGIGEAFASALQGLGNLEIKILEFTRGDDVVKVGESFKDYVIEGDRYTNVLYGIGLTKPADYDFDDYERDLAGPNFTLVNLEGDADVQVRALPASFAFSMQEFRDQIQKRLDGRIVFESAKPLQGRQGLLCSVEGDGELHRILALVDQDTCFTFSMEIEEKERDLEVFERIVASIRFIDG